MSDKVEVNSSSLGLGSILTIIFVLAKLFHVVNWSWWVVFSPFIVSAAIGLAVLAFAMVVAGIAVYYGSK